MSDEMRLGVEVEVGQAMLDADPTLVEKGFKVGDKTTRQETDEEAAARFAKEEAESAGGGGAPAETPEEKAAREEKEAGDANEAAGLNRDGTSKEPAQLADEGQATRNVNPSVAPTNGERHPLA